MGQHRQLAPEKGVAEITTGRGRRGDKETYAEGGTEVREHEDSGVRKCEWQVTAVGTTSHMLTKWRQKLPLWHWTACEDEKWPLCVVGSGNDIVETISKGARTPEWVVVDGGELHRTSVEVLKARHLKKWGVRGSLSIWAIHLDKITSHVNMQQLP